VNGQELMKEKQLQQKKKAMNVSTLNSQKIKNDDNQISDQENEGTRDEPFSTEKKKRSYRLNRRG